MPEFQHGQGQRLGDRVVQIGGNPPPLPLAGLYQLRGQGPQSLTIGAKPLLGLPALGDVAVDADDQHLFPDRDRRGRPFIVILLPVRPLP